MRGTIAAVVVTAATGIFGSVAPPADRVTRVVVHKTAHTMELLDGERVVRSYRVSIGPGGAGVKRREGDQVTPVGSYHVVQRSPSKYRIFMLLDYPNADDRTRFAQAKARGDLPKDATIGGAIGVHGAPPGPAWKALHKTVDWTAGCVAVDDDEIVDVARLVKDGTPVDIED